VTGLPTAPNPEDKGSTVTSHHDYLRKMLKLSLCLNKHHTMKTCEKVEV
jgi:hypothetical protein